MNSLNKQFVEGTQVLATVGDLVRWGASQLAAGDLYFGHGTDNAADEARVLVFFALNLDFSVPDYFYSARVTEQERSLALDLLWQRISEQKPAAYLTGQSWFASLCFNVDERVLVPRSPLAELIERRFEPWLADGQPTDVLDLCTGSGCIAIACSYVFDEANIDASDIDEGALEVARSNVELHDVEDQVVVIRSDLYENLGDKRYDLIVSNPPYVPASSLAELPAEYHHEPKLALLAEDDGMALVRQIISGAVDHLQDDGILVVEVGEIASYVAEEFAELDLHWVEFEKGGDGVFVVTAQELQRVFSPDV